MWQIHSNRSVEHLLSNISQLNWDWSSIIRVNHSWAIRGSHNESFPSSWLKPMSSSILFVQSWICFGCMEWESYLFLNTLSWERTQYSYSFFSEKASFDNPINQIIEVQGNRNRCHTRRTAIVHHISHLNIVAAIWYKNHRPPLDPQVTWTAELNHSCKTYNTSHRDKVCTSYVSKVAYCYVYTQRKTLNATFEWS